MAIRVRQQDYVRIRIERLFWVIAACYIALVARLVYLQAVRGEYFMEKAKDVRAQVIPQVSLRGGLEDRSGRPLAVTTHTSRLVCDPTLVKNAEATAEALSSLCQVNASAIHPRLVKGQRFPDGRLRRNVTVIADISPDSAEAVRTAAKSRAMRSLLRGISVAERVDRSYPSGREAVHVTGFLIPGDRGDAKGISGLELALDGTLGGADGYLKAEVDARGRVIPNTEVERIPVSHGLDARLTLDSTIQHIAESELSKCTGTSKPVSATVVVLDPKTGDVLALVSYPDFDPVTRVGLKERPESLMNRAISLYEPGSTLKTITVASAIDSELITPSTVINCGGTLRLGRRSIKCAMHGGSRAHGKVDMKRLIEDSCNVASAQIGIKMGMEGLNEHLGRFGLLDQTGVGLPYEMRGRLGFGINPLEGGAPKAARVAFGQSVLVSPLALAAAYGAIANEGKLIRPRIIKEYLESGGRVRRAEKAADPQQVISPETASRMCEYLQAVVTDGTGKTANVPGYTVAGKTGTAQKVAQGSKSYSGGKYIASFFGFLPASDPKAVIAVVVDEPKGAYYGAQVAAPVFQRIAQRLMWYLKVPPDSPNSGGKTQMARH